MAMKLVQVGPYQFRVRPADLATYLRAHPGAVVVGDADAGVETESGDPIPDGFPGAEALANAGYATVVDIPRDEAELMAINGIGNATAARILEALDA